MRIIYLFNLIFIFFIIVRIYLYYTLKYLFAICPINSLTSFSLIKEIILLISFLRQNYIHTSKKQIDEKNLLNFVFFKQENQKNKVKQETRKIILNFYL